MSSNITPPPRQDVNPVSYQIRDLIYGVAGIFHNDNRLAFLEDRCGRRIAPTRCTCC